jgi:hypothetical protein
MKIFSSIILFLLVLNFRIQLNAQNFHYGFQAGLVVANSHLLFEPELEHASNSWDPILSYDINGHVSFRSNGFWGLSTEPGYMQKGELQKYNKDDSNDDVRIQLNYLQIPVLWQSYFAKIIFISLGPEFAYLLNVKAKSESNKVDISKYFEKKFEVSGIIGGGVTLIHHIDIEFRYNHGITYLRKLSVVDILGNPQGEVTEYNQYFQLVFRLKL